jgi:hypothetical protein
MSARTKIALVSALVLGSATVAFAQSLVPEVDGDGNRTGVYDVLPQARSPQARGSIEGGFAGPRHRVSEPASTHGANGPEWQLYFDNWLSRGGQGSGATMSGFRGR